MTIKRYAFHLDASSCTGCKACQIACKDKHGLPLGVLWRRVYEVAGGGWKQIGQTWVPNVFAYNLSIACNHCEVPACVEACPSGAMHQRPDGIVLVDPEKCLGCRYCSWACPYGAPQYDPTLGIMTKCTFCVDNLEAGKPPTCVSACPMRALDFGERDELEARYGPPAEDYPLPQRTLTRPALFITSHPDAQRARQLAEDSGQGGVANPEEVGTA